MPDFARAALMYASRGLPVFPIVPGKKTPLTTHGVLDASINAEQIQEWWRRWPSANIGLACGKISDLIILDFDIKNGKAGYESFFDLSKSFPAVGDTLIAATPSQGLHTYLRYAPGLRNAVDVLPGVDIRTDGGYVLLAPSEVDGAPYRWIQRVQPLAMPDGLVSRLQRPDSESQPARPSMPSSFPATRLSLIERASKYVAAVPGAVEGEGGDVTTFKLACRLVRGFHLSDNETLLVLWSWNQRCLPPWSERDLISKIKSARTNGREAFGGRMEASRR